MPPIITKVTTGGDRVLRQSQFRGNADSFVVGSYEEMSNNHASPISLSKVSFYVSSVIEAVNRVKDTFQAISLSLAARDLCY